MFLFTKPSAKDIETFLDERRSDVLSYTHVGATREPSPPKGYDIDHNRQLLGAGGETFRKAKQAVRRWKPFDIPALDLYFDDTPIEPGRNVALLAEHLAFYSLNSCRIVYVIDEEHRFGFAYGTLTEHLESGEERFTVEFFAESGEVWYDIYAFSRPGHILVKLGYPYARRRQKSFAVASMAAMSKAVR